MKKHIYLLLPLLTLAPTLATQKIITSTIIASTLVLSHSSYDKKRSLDLHQAVEQNNTTNALQLINNPQVDINAKVDYGNWNKGYTPLIMCVDKGDDALPIAQELLKHQHINVNLQDEEGWTPLLMCAYIGDGALHIAQELLKHQHIKVNLQNNDGTTPLIWCAENGDKSLKIAQTLLKHKEINVNLQQKDGSTPLIMCCQAGDISLNITTLLLQHPHIQINVKDTYHKNPLHHTCAKGALKTLHLLLKQPTIHQIINQLDHQKNTPLDILFEHITGQHPDTTHVTAWSMLVLEGALLNQHIQNYQQLHPSNFNNPQKAYVHFIKENPPKKLSSKKHPTLPQNNLNKQLTIQDQNENKEDE